MDREIRERLDAEEARLVQAVAELFFEREMTAKQIAKELNLKSREMTYPLLAKARKYRMVEFHPPLEEELARRIVERYSRFKAITLDQIQVVNARGENSGTQVAKVAADKVFSLLKEVGEVIGSEDRNVGLALAPGRASRDVSICLAELLNGLRERFPKLTVYALASGCPFDEPQFSSQSFFNLFPADIAAEFVGLFATTLVRADEFEDLKKNTHGVKEAFGFVDGVQTHDPTDKMDVIVTSMGALKDEHDLLRKFLERSGGKDYQKLLDAGAQGSVAYRPFSKQGPILEEGAQLRPVTLMELKDLREFARQRDKHVVLLARECGKCHKVRVDALRPILEVPELRVWNHLVLDIATARELLDEGPVTPIPPYRDGTHKPDREEPEDSGDKD